MNSAKCLGVNAVRSMCRCSKFISVELFPLGVLHFVHSALSSWLGIYKTKSPSSNLWLTLFMHSYQSHPNGLFFVQAPDLIFVFCCFYHQHRQHGRDYDNCPLVSTDYKNRNIINW